MEFRKRIHSFIKVAFCVMIVLLIIYTTTRISMIGYDFGYRVFTESAIDEKPGQDVVIQINEGMTGKDVGVELEKKGLVRDANLFYIQLKLSAYSGKIRTGTYTLNTSMTPKEMMVVMSSVRENPSMETGE